MNWLRLSWCDYGHNKFTTIVIEKLSLFIEGRHHITMKIMLTTVVLDVLRPWSSDKVFKSLGKSTNFLPFHLIEWLSFCKIKLAPKHEFFQKNACKWHKNSHEISLQKWFINLPILEHCLSSSNYSSSLIKIKSPKSKIMYQKPPFIQK